MSMTMKAAPDPEVAGHLAAYDKTRSPDALHDAAAAASRHDGETAADPAAGIAAGEARLANWLAILGRFQRDLDADFDPDHPPSMNIIPPGKFGNQYSPGVNPKNVKDPEMRAAYIAAIEKNRILLQNFGANTKLHEAQQIIREAAVRSVADAHHSLGLGSEAIRAALAGAAIMDADRAALAAAAN